MDNHDDHRGHSHSNGFPHLIDANEVPLPTLIEKALELKPDNFSLIIRLAFFDLDKEFGPFLDENALTWVKNNTELIANEQENGAIGVEFEAVPMTLYNEDPNTVTTPLEKKPLVN